VSIKTLVGKFAAVISRVAVIPSSTGIRMSMRTTSGRVRPPYDLDCLLTVGGRPDHLATACLQVQLQPRADQLLVVSNDHPDHGVT
jgi:hypothetical protein